MPRVYDGVADRCEPTDDAFIAGSGELRGGTGRFERDMVNPTIGRGFRGKREVVGFTRRETGDAKVGHGAVTAARTVVVASDNRKR